jgi:hypothetical protein
LAENTSMQFLADLILILVKLVVTLCLSLVGLFVGAAIFHFTGGVIYQAIFGSTVTNGAECARGMLFGWLCIFSGALLGVSTTGIYTACKLFSSDEDTCL